MLAARNQRYQLMTYKEVVAQIPFSKHVGSYLNCWCDIKAINEPFVPVCVWNTYKTNAHAPHITQIIQALQFCAS